MPLEYAGWAYVSCSAGTGADSAGGPTGSIQFHSGSSVPGGSGLSGSANLLYLTASSLLTLTGNMHITGTLMVSGNVIAKNFDVINHTITYLSSSGDSKFGDTTNDTHQFTGSVYVSVASSQPSIFAVSASGAQPSVGINTDTPHASLTLSGSYAIQYHSTAVDYSVASTDYFIVVSVASKISVQLQDAVLAGRGRVVIVKAATAAPDLTVSASFGDTIDGDVWQKLYSDHASETYVCDGVSAWYIV